MKPLSELIDEFTQSLTQTSDNFVKEIEHAKGLHIYRSSVLGARVKMLQSIFPCCLDLVGETYFLNLCKVFLAKAKQTSPDLSQLAQHFPSYIRSFKPVHEQLPYLGDVAALEWAWVHQSTLPRVGTLPIQETMQLHSSASIIQSPFNILKIWQGFLDKEKGNIDITGDVCVVVWRDGDGVAARALTIFEHEILQKQPFSLQTLSRSTLAPETLGAAVGRLYQEGILHS